MVESHPPETAWSASAIGPPGPGGQPEKKKRSGAASCTSAQPLLSFERHKALADNLGRARYQSFTDCRSCCCEDGNAAPPVAGREKVKLKSDT